MKNEKPIIFCLLFPIFCILLLILIIIAGFFIVIFVSNVLDDKKISAKEGFNLIMKNDSYKPFNQNITEISSRGLSKNGKADNWFFHFKVEFNGSYNFFYVNIAKNGTCFHFDNQTGYIDDQYIRNWEIDSIDIMKKAEDLDCVKDFKRDHWMSLSPHGPMRFEPRKYGVNEGCEVILYYHAGGGMARYYEMLLYFNGSNGDLIEVVHPGWE